MKSFKFYALLMPLTIGLVSLASCSSDDENQGTVTPPGADSIPESGDVTSFDQVKFLQNNIVEIDSVGNMVQRVNGAPLDTADTTVLSIKVADVNAAKEMFKSWLSPDTETEPISPSTVDVKAALKDGNGAVKETVYFKSVNDGNDVAEMTFDGNGVFKHFTKVKFTTMWPLNSGRSPYHVGDREQHDTYEEGMKNWVCVREAKEGVAGLMVYVSTRVHRWGFAYIGNFASPSLAKAASEAMRSNNNWDTFVAFFKDAGMNLESGAYYWIDDWKYFVVGGGVYAIRLSDGDIDWFDILYHPSNDKHFLQVRTFGLIS